MDYEQVLAEIAGRVSSNPATDECWTEAQVEAAWFDAFSRPLRENFGEIDARGKTAEEFINEVVEFLLDEG